jgi:hypothetical protein
MDEDEAIVRGVGAVCISASSLEWSLAYLTSVLWRKGDAWFVDVFCRPGKPLKTFRKFVGSLEVLAPELKPQAEQILTDAHRLLSQRHRVAHSAMMGKLQPGSNAYEAWHGKTDTMWSVEPAELQSLAHDLNRCAAEADTFGAAWEERAERDHWADLS